MVFYVVQQYLLAALGKTTIIINLTTIAIYDSSNFLDYYLAVFRAQTNS